MVHYRIYGLEVASDVPLSGVTPSPSRHEPDVVCHLRALPAEVDLIGLQREQPMFVSRLRDSQGLPILRVWRASPGGHYCLRYADGLTFVVDGDGHRVWAQWDGSVTAELASAFLLGQILGFLLHLRGYVCMHASAVAIDDRAVLFAGIQGRGKSSTAAALAKRGYPVLSDDVAPIGMDADGQLRVTPGLPRVCLWPDSAEFLYGPEVSRNLPRVQAQENKRMVGFDSRPEKFPEGPLPLGAVYLLAPRSDGATAPRIEPVGTAERLVQLLPNALVSGALDSRLRAREFEIQGAISRSVPVQRLVPSSDPEKLAELCDLVLNDVRSASLI